MNSRLRPPAEHGTQSRYSRGCRCEPCRAANTAYIGRHRDANRWAYQEANRRSRRRTNAPKSAGGAS